MRVVLAVVYLVSVAALLVWAVGGGLSRRLRPLLMPGPADAYCCHCDGEPCGWGCCHRTCVMAWSRSSDDRCTHCRLQAHDACEVLSHTDDGLWACCCALIIPLGDLYWAEGR